MAPEQALSTKHADARSDIYSLGMTLWYLLTGRPAYEGDTLMARLLAHREAPIPALSAARAGVPEPVMRMRREIGSLDYMRVAASRRRLSRRNKRESRSRE